MNLESAPYVIITQNEVVFNIRYQFISSVGCVKPLGMSAVHPNARPIDLAGHKGAVLCIHGLSGTPYEVKPIAVELHRRGYRVLCPLLIGHGRSNQALANSRWMDWYVSAKRAFEELSKDWDEVMIVGFSMGGLIALKLAHEKGERVKGVAALAPAYELDYLTALKLRLVKRFGIGKFLPDFKKRSGPDVSDPDVAALMPSNDAVPIAAAVSLMDGQKAVSEVVSRIARPVWIFQGKKDHTVPVHSARHLFSKLKNTNRRLLFYAKSWHILALDVEHHEVIEDVCDYVDSLFNNGLSVTGEEDA